MNDSKLWEEAFKAYRSPGASLSSKAQRRRNRRTKKGKIENIAFNSLKTKDSITEVTKNFYRWKKTEDYIKWRKKQFLKQGGLCWYCEDFMPYIRINVEHIIPRSGGGTNQKSNLVLSCSNCNKRKGSKLLDEQQIIMYRQRSKKHRGTYLKNKEYYQNMYGQYSDNAFIEMCKNF
jgi:5-methylcytosine-specific restriction endonuclease McrA